MARDVDGNVLKKGDWVAFKCDIEQYGVIKKIQGNTLTLENKGGFEGGYIGGDTMTTETSDRVWLDE